jgi:ABC-type molybdate transport system substrate-binding protein
MKIKIRIQLCYVIIIIFIISNYVILKKQQQQQQQKVTIFHISSLKLNK